MSYLISERNEGGSIRHDLRAFVPSNGHVENIGPLCAEGIFIAELFSLAEAGDGTLWVADTGGDVGPDWCALRVASPVDAHCDAPVEATQNGYISALAVGGGEKNGTLFAILLSKQLVEVDGETGAFTQVLDLPSELVEYGGLTGTSDGRLVACAYSGGYDRTDIVTIDLASKTVVSNVAIPYTPCRGLTVFDGQLLVYSGQEILRYVPSDHSLEPFVFDLGFPVVAAASAPCSSLD